MAFRKSQAAFFDFDGLWFKPGCGWIIKDVRLGPLGARIPWEVGCRQVAELQRKYPSLQISDCFNISHYEWPGISIDAGLYITPPDTILQTAYKHLSRHNDLFVISCSGYRDLLTMTDTWLPEKSPYPLLSNPFKRAHFLTLSTDKQTIMPKSPDEQVRNKLQSLTAMLRYNSQSQEGPARQNGRYSKLFLYYTQPEYHEQLKIFLKKEQSSLEDGRLALISSYIAEVI